MLLYTIAMFAPLPAYARRYDRMVIRLIVVATEMLEGVDVVLKV